jgi:serralysin
MASPFVRVDENGTIIADSAGKYSADLSSYFSGLRGGSLAAGSTIASHANATVTGSLDGKETGGYDLVAFNLTAGQTYTFSYRGTAQGGIEDPYLALLSTSGSVITEDDDGGFGRTSQISFTPTSDGTYYLYATSWYTLAYGDATMDTGGYTIDVWVQNAAHDAGGTVATAEAVGPGTVHGYIDTTGDVDVYAVNLTDGMFYSFTYAGGIDSSADWDGEAGETIGVVELLDAQGNVVSTAPVGYDTALNFLAQDSGTYYVRVSAYDAGPPAATPNDPLTGGYTLDIQEVDPANEDPLEAINWESAANVPFVDVNGVPTAYVYFAPAGENFGETNDYGGPMRTWGWNDYEIQQVMLALDQYEAILGVNYVRTEDPDQATFRLLTTKSDAYGAYAYPQDPDYGTQQGILVFNIDSGGWNYDQQQSLEQGGYAFAVILHEFGHAHGLAHPHDDGGGSEVLLGAQTYEDYGIYDLNQGVYTVMSYNDAWELHPDGESPYTGATVDSGWSGTLSAFDIAALQQRYGVHAYNTGNNVYTLTDVQDDAFYQTIWDTGGTDSIVYSGTHDAQIDLLAATLDYSPTGGGVISFVDDVWGGYTIANGVVIENASGGSGDDVLLGNSAANVLSGNGGNDTLVGRGGNDTLNGGAGSDTVSYVSSGSGVTINLKSGSGRGDGSDTLISIENAVGSGFNDTLTGSDAANVLNGGGGNDTLSGGKGLDTYVFTDAGTDTISGYETGEDIDLSGLGVTMSDVTILSDRIVVDLQGAQDLTILFNTKGFSTTDLILAASTASSSSAAPALADPVFTSGSHGGPWNSPVHQSDYYFG